MSFWEKMEITNQSVNWKVQIQAEGVHKIHTVQFNVSSQHLENHLMMLSSSLSTHGFFLQDENRQTRCCQCSVSWLFSPWGPQTDGLTVSFLTTSSDVFLHTSSHMFVHSTFTPLFRFVGYTTSPITVLSLISTVQLIHSHIPLAVMYCLFVYFVLKW